MTDSEMMKVFRSLASEDMSEAEMAISMLVAVEMAKREEVSKSEVVFSER